MQQTRIKLKVYILTKDGCRNCCKDCRTCGVTIIKKKTRNITVLQSSFPFIHFFVSFSSDLLVLLCSFVILINLNFLLLDDWPQSVSKSVNSTLMYLHTVQSRTVDRSFAYNLQHKAKLSVELWTIDRATIITRTKILWEMYNINALTCFTHYRNATQFICFPTPTICLSDRIRGRNSLRKNEIILKAPSWIRTNNHEMKTHQGSSPLHQATSLWCPSLQASNDLFTEALKLWNHTILFHCALQ